MKILVARDDVEVDSKDRNDRSPLFYAAGKGHDAVAKILVRDDVEVNTKDRNGLRRYCTLPEMGEKLW